MTVLSALGRYRLIPVVVLDSSDDAVALGTALVEGGLPIAEVTLRTPAALAAIEHLADRGDVIVGAGTVTTPEQAEAACAAGARFIVSPGISQAVLETCAELGIPSVPGAVTATEVQAALELGASTVKFFPASLCGGPAMITALAAPFGDVKFIPTGGVDPSNLAEYLRLPAVVAVGGSWMVPRDRLRAGDFDAIRSLVAEAAALASTHPPVP